MAAPSKRSGPLRGCWMSSPTWTPAALASESVHYEGLGWRFGTCRWRLLRLRGVRDRHRRDRLLPSALLRRVARDAVAEGGRRIHGVQRRVGSQSCDRSDGSTVRRAPCDLDASDLLRRVPGTGGHGQECPTRTDTIRIRSGSARRRQSGRARLRGVLGTASDRAPYLAHSDRRSRSAGTLRVPETRGRIPARNLHRSPAGFALKA